MKVHIHHINTGLTTAYTYLIQSVLKKYLFVGVYTRVTEYDQWIRDTIAKDKF